MTTLRTFPRKETARWLCWGLAIVIVMILSLARKPWDLPAPGSLPYYPLNYLAVYGWWTAAFNVVLLFTLGALAPFWTQPASGQSPWLLRVPIGRGVVLATLMAMAVLLFNAWPRMSQSLWDDEENSVRRLIAGQYKEQKDGSWKFRPAKWSAALWNYRRPTNHHLQTLASKALHEAWRTVARPVAQPFSETIIRLPSLLAGLLVLPAVAALMWQLGFPRAGALCAWLLALHPWFLRYASEARGYMLAILFSIFATIALIRAIDSGKWRWWALFAISWLAMLYANPGTITVMMLLNLCAPVALWFRCKPGTRATQIWRWMVSGCLAGMVFLQLMIPCVPQVVDFLKDVMGGTLTARWHASLLAHFLSGLTWNICDTPTPAHPELRWLVESSPLVAKLLIGAALLLAAAGWVRLFVRQPAGWITAIVWALAPFAVYLVARSRGAYLYEWYLVFALPGAVACLAMGADGLARTFLRKARPLDTVFIVAMVTVFFLATSPARRALRSRPLECLREAAEIARDGHSMWHPASNQILIATAAVDLESYEPRVQPIHDVNHLNELIQSTWTSGKKLVVVMGNPWSLGAHDPQLATALADLDLFEELKTLPGFDPTLTQKVLRLKQAP
ncbi:MAG: hypothetical protein Fur0032_16930 [Terrimicrobiaceae bacterium]